jgi:predicted AlkP superfamily phosphohydrolase/phosphomutase
MPSCPASFFKKRFPTSPIRKIVSNGTSGNNIQSLEQSFTMNKKRIMIIGLDGATFDIIRPMIKAGRLPTIAKLMTGGAWGNLRSTVLPITPPAWASFMTGKNPGKHGVFAFYTRSTETYETQMATGLSIRAKKIWDYLDVERICLIDIPMTFPPQEVNGYMISGWPVPSEESIFTYPPGLHTEIIREVGVYMMDTAIISSDTNVSLSEMIRCLYMYTEARKNASLYLLKKKGPFDIFSVVFRGTDFVQHGAFKFLDEEYCKKNPDLCKKFKDVIFQFYEKMDTIVADLIRSMGEDSITVLMSDHGGGPVKKMFYINRWLQQEGFLSLKRGTSLNGISVRRKPLSDILQRIGASYLNFFIPSLLKKLKIPYLKPYTKHPSLLVDWRKTKAFANLTWPDEIIRINMEGREPLGTVSRKDYEAVRDEIIERLSEVKDPDTGEKIIDKVYRREEIYHGPYLEDAPDILALTNNTSYRFMSALGDGAIFERPEDPRGLHRMDGIFVIKGPDIKAGRVLSGLSITDIAPTVLYLMGKPIPDGMDGRIISEAIDEEFFKTNPPSYYKDEEESVLKKKSIQEFTSEEKRKIDESLKALGYME